MKFVCDKCGAQYKIKDEKIGPNGVSVRCKKCEHKIIVRLPPKEPEFPEFPSDGGTVPSDMEETRQMANPLVLQQQEAQEGGSKKAKEKASGSESGVKSRTKAPQKSPAKEASKTPDSKSPEKSSESEVKSSTHLSGEWGDLPPSENAGAVSSLPFDLGLGKDEALNQALDPVLGEEKSDASEEDSSPFGALSTSFGTDDGDGDVGDGNATRVVNLAAMASLMKASASPEPQPESKAEPAPSSSTPGEEWFVAIDGQQQGPMDFEGLKAHWDRGEISAESLVWNAGMADWAALRTVPELSKRLEPPKPAMSDIPMPVSTSESKVDEWGLPVAEKSQSSAPMAASLPSPQKAADAPAWKPAAASMLSSLLQDEMSAIDEPPAPAPVPAASASMAPAPAPAPMAVSAMPMPVQNSALPELAPLPAPSQIPVPQASIGEFPLVPPSAQDAFSPEMNDFQVPSAPPRQNPNAPLPALGIDPENSPRDSTMPDASTSQDTGFNGTNWDFPAAPAPSLPTHQNRGSGRGKQGAPRRQDNNRRAHNMTIQQPLPQMPSKSSGVSKGLLGVGIVALLVALALVALKLISTDTPEVIAQAPVPLAPQASAVPPATPPVAPVAPEASAEPTADQPSAPVAQVAPPPVASDVQPAVATPAVEAPAPAKEVEAPASAKSVSSGSEKKVSSNKKVKKNKLKKPQRVSKVSREEEDDDDSDFDDDDEESGSVVAAAPPKPAPLKPEPANKVDDDFERLFGGGSSSSSAASAPAPAKKPTVYVPPPTGGASKVTLSQSDIMGEVVKHRGAIKRCTDEEEDSDTIVMVWVIQKSGKPSGIKTASPNYRGSDLEECLKGVINGMKFPAYSGDQMQPIKFPFKF